MLSILFITTHRCNLRCAYCYEDAAHTGADMSGEDAHSAFMWARHLAEHRRDSEILFMWFGGEPFTIGMRRMKELLQIQGDVFSGVPINVRNVVQTNMTMWDEEIVSMVRKHFDNSISVSLDFNPQFRVFANRTPSRKVVLENVARLKAADVRVGIVGTLTRADIGFEKEIYAFYKALNSPFRLNRAHGVGDGVHCGLEFMSVCEFDEFVCNVFDVLLNDSPPRALFLNYYDAVNALKTGKRSGCRLAPDQGMNFTFEPEGIISDWCRFGGRLGSYRDVDSYTNFNINGWCCECPQACSNCDYYNVICSGACEYEIAKSCEESNCGFRTERTRRQLDFVRRYFDSFGIRHCFSCEMEGGEK